MKGHGRTVMKGTRVENFQVEILGVLRNTSPGRDLVLARLSGLGLDKSGVIAGMSGSPVYIDNKLVGAIAYAWPFGKEPIAGITPFSQMHAFVEAFDRREQAARGKPMRVGLREPVRIGGREYDAVTVSGSFDEPAAGDRDGLWMAPLRTPLAATGFTRNSLKLLAEHTGRFGLVPMTGGATTARVNDEEKDVTIEAGGPLAVSLISGDFDLSGIGTVTHVEGTRVYGWGHPFMSLGACQLPMSTGYIHTVYPRLTVSFKMGSPLREVGVMNADVSTCIAGTLGRKADTMPLRTTVALSKSDIRTYNVRIAQHRPLVPSLVFTSLVNAIDMEGELPEEMTAHVRARIELDGKGAIVIEDTFSGMPGARAPAAVYTPVAATLSQLTYNSFRALAIKRIDCETRVEPGRSAAEVESAALDSEEYCPGDTVTATVSLRPYRGASQPVRLRLKLPADLAEGSYTATVCDEPTSARFDLRGDPALYIPSNEDQVLAGARLLAGARRTTLALRVPVGAHGVSAGGKSMPDLPGSMVRILTHGRRTGAMTMTRALVARQSTRWVIQGAESLTFRVTKTRKVTRHER
jgi:hypothetical protein